MTLESVVGSANGARESSTASGIEPSHVPRPPNLGPGASRSGCVAVRANLGPGVLNLGPGVFGPGVLNLGPALVRGEQSRVEACVN